MLFESQMDKYIKMFMPKIIELMKKELKIEIEREGNIIKWKTTMSDEVIYEAEVDITPE